MRYLLDTCIISELVRKRPAKQVVSWVREQDELSLFVSVVTFGEIEMGITKVADDRRRQTLRSWVDRELQRRFMGRILPFDYETACRWGVIMGETEKDGTPIPVIDGQLAATALVHGLVLVTRNTSDVAPARVPVLNPWDL